MKKIVLFILALFPCFTQAHVQSPEGLVIHCKPVLQNFINAEQESQLLSYESMSSIFLDLPQKYSAQRKLIRTDINACRKFIRRYASHSILYQKLLQELLLLYDYIKEHQECCKAIQFHKQLQERYQLAFNNHNIVACIETTPELYGVAQCKYKCRAYFNKISRDLRTIDKFEDRLHGDYSVLKAHNYVYKIELIKVRNFVYHHNIYKFETRYF